MLTLTLKMTKIMTMTQIILLTLNLKSEYEAMRELEDKPTLTEVGLDDD